MKKIISLSKYPGNNGKNHYTKFFKHFNLDYIYEPKASDNLFQDLENSRNENIHGISISMPFKTSVIPYLDFQDDNVVEFNSCNTILIKNNKFYGYNTDFFGAKYIKHTINRDQSITILGNGSMANMFKKMLNNFNLNIFSKSLNNWQERHKICDVIINCTALGTIDKNSPLDVLPNCNLVIDLAINSDNMLFDMCKRNRVKYIPGIEFYKYQFFEQFEIYTNLKINQSLYNRVMI